jgi:hypothetical protein
MGTSSCQITEAVPVLNKINRLNDRITQFTREVLFRKSLSEFEGAFQSSYLISSFNVYYTHIAHFMD